MKEYEQKICNIADSMKAQMLYQCNIAEEQAYKQGHKRGYVEGYEIGKQDGYEEGQESLVNAYAIGKGEATLEDIKEAEYNRGLNDAWTVAKKIVLGASKGGYPMEVLHRIFSFSDLSDIFSIYDVTDAIARIKAYEDKQKQDDWRDIPSEEMTLEQARRAVKELRAEVVGKILAEGE